MPAAAPFVVMAVGSAVSAGAAVYSGIQQKKAADYNAKMSEQNAKAIDVQTREAIRRQREQNRQAQAMAAPDYSWSASRRR